MYQTMYRTYEFTRTVNGEAKQDMVMLFYPKGTDIELTLHKLGLEYCMNRNKGKTPPHGLTFAQLMEYITPEMLDPYGITVLWPNSTAISMDDAPPIINRYEMETYRETINYVYSRTKKVCKTAEQIAKRLETQRKQGHPAISTWAPDIISVKAVTWADQFVHGSETDLSKFFQKKLQEAKPHPNNGQAPDMDAANDAPEGQCEEQTSQ